MASCDRPIGTSLLKSYYEERAYNKVWEIPLEELDLSDPEVLFILAEINTGDGEEAYKYYVKAAKLGHPASWARLGSYYSLEGPDQDLKKSEEYFKKACELGYEWSCCYGKNHCTSRSFKTMSRWVDFLMGQGRVKEAWGFLKGADDTKDPEIAFFKGVFYEKGIQIPRDLNKAEEYYLKAFHAGSSKAAYQLGIFYLRKNKTKSQYYFDKACKMGFASGCLARYTGQVRDDYSSFVDKKQKYRFGTDILETLAKDSEKS